MSDIFDVARWSKQDVKQIMDELGINVKDVNGFISDVVENLENNFDASIGINWDVIKYHVEDVNSNWRD